MAARRLLTIDLGTSGPKVAVVSETGTLLGVARRHVPTQHGTDGVAEQDAEVVWQVTVDAAREAIAAAGCAVSDYAGVVASAQYSSIVPVDRDARPVAPMITWMDHRGAPRRLARLAGHPRFTYRPDRIARSVRLHGLAPVEAGMSIGHMRWLRFGAPDVYENAATFLEPVDYLVARLTGRHTANRCSAFMQLLADNRDPVDVPAGEGWDPDLVALSLIDPAKLPERVPVGSIVGTLRRDVAEDLGLSEHTPVLSGINDTQAGAIAAGAWQGTHAGLAIGTTSVITTHLDHKKLNPLRTLFTTPSPVGVTHLVAAENGLAGGAVDHFLERHVYPTDGFATTGGSIERYAAFELAVATTPPGAHGVLFLPWLAGSLAPDTDAHMRGGFLGIGLDTTREDLARAIVEGVALDLRRLQGPVETFIGRTISHHVFYGGGSASPAWAQVLADVLDRPVHRVAQGGYANSFGTAMFGFEHLGIVSAAELAAHLEVADVAMPDLGHRARYDELSEVFGDAFGRTRRIMHRLERSARQT